MPPQTGSPMWERGAVAASSTLHRVLPREVTYVRPRSHIPLLWADDTGGWVPSHVLTNLRIPGPGAGPEALSWRNPHLGWFSVGVRRLEEARATGLACRDAYSRLLTPSSLRSPGGPGVCSRLLSLVGWFCDGRVAVFCPARGYGRRRAWRTMMSPTRAAQFPFRPLHARLARCWPACVWSVYGPVVISAAVWLVHGSVSRLMVGLFVVWSFLLLRRLRVLGCHVEDVFSQSSHFTNHRQ